MNKQSLLKNGLWATYGAIAGRVLILVSNLLLARLLLPSEFGVIAVAYIFWAFVNIFNQNTAGTFIVYKGVDDKRYLDTAFTISLGFGLILALAMVAISPLAAHFFNVPSLVGILGIFAFNLLVSSAQSVYVGVLSRQLRYRELANLTLLASLARVAVTVSAALLGCSYWSFAIGDTASTLILTGLTQRRIEHRFRLRIDPQARSEVLAFCTGGVGNSLGYYFNYNCDNFVIGRLLGSTSLGFYNLAYQLTNTLTNVLTQALGDLGMSSLAQISDDRQQEAALVKVVEHTAFLAAPVYAVLSLLLDPQVVTFVFGEQWTPICAVIPWLMFYAYFRLVNLAMIAVLNAKGKPQVSARVNLAIAPIAAVSFFFAAQQGGILAVSIAVALLLGMVWTLLTWWVGCRALKWSVGKFLIACFKPVGFALAVSSLVFSLPILIKPIAFLLVYLVTVRLFAAAQFGEYQALFRRFTQRLSVYRP